MSPLLQVTADGVIDIPNIFQADSTILSNTRTFCILPIPAHTVSATYKLAISFDGENFSEETLVYVYDSSCIDCTLGQPCTMKVMFYEIM